MENSRESVGSISNIALIVIAVVFWAVGGFIAYDNGGDWFLPEAASVEADAIDDLFRFMLGVGTFIFLLVETSLIYFVVRYGLMRNRSDDSDGPPIHGNNTLEIVWTIIPSIIVFVLTILSFQVLIDTTEAKDDEFAINVTAQRFFWQFEYPVEGEEELELTTNHILVIPEGEVIRLSMDSVDVIHAFWVPQFRVKQDVMPGRTTELRFTPNQVTGLPPDFELVTLDDLEVPGPDDACPVEEEVTTPEVVDVAEAVDETVDGEAASEEGSEDAGSVEPPVDYEEGFDIVCAELCGLNHGLMRGEVFVVEREEYDAFVETLRAREIANTAQGEYARRCGGAALLEAGRNLFGPQGFNCAQCHQLEDAGVLTMGAGPSLNGVGDRAVDQPNYDDAEDYLLTSIINPNAFIVDGYPAALMPANFADQMTPEQLETMVSYLALMTEQ